MHVGGHTFWKHVYYYISYWKGLQNLKSQKLYFKNAVFSLGPKAIIILQSIIRTLAYCASRKPLHTMNPGNGSCNPTPGLKASFWEPVKVNHQYWFDSTEKKKSQNFIWTMSLLSAVLLQVPITLEKAVYVQNNWFFSHPAQRGQKCATFKLPYNSITSQFLKQNNCRYNSWKYIQTRPAINSHKQGLQHRFHFRISLLIFVLCTSWRPMGNFKREGFSEARSSYL